MNGLEAEGHTLPRPYAGLAKANKVKSVRDKEMAISAEAIASDCYVCRLLEKDISGIIQDIDIPVRKDTGFIPAAICVATY